MYREAYWILGGISKRKVPLGIPLRRTNPRGGLAIAFLGSDGAGKSTLLADTRTWLGQKLDVYPIYMGSGDGSASLLRLPLKLARRVVEGSVDGSAKTKDGSGEKRKTSGFRKVGKLPWALSLAAEKRGKLKRLVRARNRGLVVICDRYPQNQTKGFNDGPLLDGYRDDDSAWLQRAAQWEAGAYDLAAATPPDLVIKLVPSTETAMERRPELPREEIQRRIDAVLAFEFAEPAKVVEINADQPLEEVIREVRSVIWDLL
jgi:thymidylate kinase